MEAKTEGEGDFLKDGRATQRGGKSRGGGAPTADWAESPLARCPQHKGHPTAVAKNI